MLAYYNDRETFAPGLDVETVPDFVALTSINNIPIEGGWHQLRKAIGETLYSHVIKGKTDGLFNPNSDIHVYVACSHQLSLDTGI